MAAGPTGTTLRVRCALTRPERPLLKLVPKLSLAVETLEIEQDQMSEHEGDWFDTHDHFGDHALADRVWDRLPGLRSLVVHSGWDIFERVDHPGIEEIVIGEGVPFCTVRDNPRPWRAPALRSIAWHYRVDCTGTGASAGPEDFEAIWRAEAPSLREVDLSRANLYVRPNETPLLEVPGFCSLLPQLEILRLPYHAVGRTPDQVLASVRQHASRLSHLRSLALTKLAGLDEDEILALVPGFSR